MSSAEHVVMSKSLTGERRRSGRIMHLLVYTMSTMVFGMICSALGPSIPWLASNADVTPETLGWLPAAQAVMCIVSGLASSLMAFVARKYHHLLLGLLLLWLGVFFMVLPLASSSIYALTLVFAFQVLPRPWIGQMTNLLVSELYEEPSLSSAAQSFNQGGFALGCVFMVMLEEISSSAFGGAAMFYIAGGFTGLSSLLFFTLPRAPEKTKISGRSAKVSGRSAKGARESKMPSAFTLTCSCLGILAVGLEVACGTWLITSMTQMGFESSLASLCNIIFWLLFAVSRLVLAPCLCKCLKPRPSSMIIGGASLAALSCIAAVAWPRSFPAVLLGVSGIALGAGPSYAMTISMAKESVELTSVDSAMFAIASSLGAGGVPFVMSRVLSLFGPEAFFPSLLVMSAILMTLTRIVGGAKDAREVETKDAIESDMESMESTQANGANSDSAVSVASEGSAASASLESSEDGLVPPIMWTYWEQGWEDAPLLCQACAKSWEGMNPHLSLQKISGADLPDLLPELCYKARFWELPAGQRSDLVRLSLLEKFGGLWVDATLFCTSPVMPWLSALKQADTSEGFFFVFERDSQMWPYDPFLDCQLPISSWFIVSTPGHPLTSKWFSVLYDKLINSSEQMVSYFVIHDTFREMMNEDEQVQELYEQIPKVSARHPHVLEFELGFATAADAFAVEGLRTSLEIAPMQKLSHKVLQDDFFLALLHPLSKPTLLSVLCSNGRIDAELRDIGDVAEHSELLLVEERRKKKVHYSWQFSVQTQ